MLCLSSIILLNPLYCEGLFLILTSVGTVGSGVDRAGVVVGRSATGLLLVGEVERLVLEFRLAWVAKAQERFPFGALYLHLAAGCLLCQLLLLLLFSVVPVSYAELEPAVIAARDICWPGEIGLLMFRRSGAPFLDVPPPLSVVLVSPVK